MQTNDTDTATKVTLTGQPITIGSVISVQGFSIFKEPYGEQFQATSYTIEKPQSLGSLEKWLSGPSFPGMGPVLAKRLIKTFGDDIWDVLDNRPQDLKSLKNFPKAVRENLIKVWADLKNDRSYQLLLQELALPASIGHQIRQTYGDDTEKIIRKDPYRLVLDIRGISLDKADRIAVHLGIDPKGIPRAQAIITHTLLKEAHDGHCWTKLSLIQEQLRAIDIDEETAQKALSELHNQSRVTCEEDRLYPTKLYEGEHIIAARITQWLKQEEKEPLTVKTKWFTSKNLNEQQEKALEHAATYAFSVLSGSPGSGKTYTVAAICDLMERHNIPVALIAPTGRAARRLTDFTKRDASTIHRFLELRPGEDPLEGGSPTEFDDIMIIMDEASMVDLSLMAGLVQKLGSRARLLLVGDVHQLPSVGPGHVFGDLLALDKIPSIALTQTMRQSEKSHIPRAAQAILNGRVPEFDKDRNGDVYFFERDNPDDALNTINNLIFERIPKHLHDIHPIRDIQVLSPTNGGPLGIEAINKHIRKKISPHIPYDKFNTGDKVIQSANNYDLDIRNGDTGYIQKISDKNIVVEFDGKNVTINNAATKNLSYAYAISIHKSQGSEYPVVIIVLSHAHWNLLYRSLVYTAITRAKRMAIIVGQKNALKKAINTVSVNERRSTLRNRIKSLYED